MKRVNTWKERSIELHEFLKEQLDINAAEIKQAEYSGVSEYSKEGVKLINRHYSLEFGITLLENLLVNNPLRRIQINARDKWIKLTKLDKTVRDQIKEYNK